MRSLSAGVAAIWFAYGALWFMPAGGGVYFNPGAQGGIDGDAGAVVLVWAARTLFAGLAFVSLALVQWSKLAALLRTPRSGE